MGEAASPAPGSHRFFDEDGVASFAFDIYRGDIRFAAEINGHPVKLLLDGGFMWDDLLLWGGPEVDSLGLVQSGIVSIGREGRENAIESTRASGIDLRLPGVELTGQTAIITPYSSGTSRAWAGSVGQVSAAFFKHFVVDINFDTMRISLLEPESFVYEGIGRTVPWRPMQIGSWSIPGIIHLQDGRRISMDFMMDLGYNDQAQIATGSEHGITTPKKAIPASLGFNIQREELRGHIARVPRIEIGGFTIQDVLASYVVEHQKDELFHEVMIGLGLLSRFNLIFDHAHRRIFLEPNGNFSAGFESNMSGMTMKRGPNDSVLVAAVAPDSPAATAGFEKEDKILLIDGKPAGDYTSWDLIPLFEREGAKVLMTIVRGGKKLELSLVLRRLI